MMNEAFIGSNTIQAYNNYDIQPSFRDGRACMRHLLMRDEIPTRWAGRPRTEVIPDQNNPIGSTMRYTVDLLVPAGFDSPGNVPVFSFHQGSGVVGIPIHIGVKGREWYSTGDRNGEWFFAFKRFYAPEIWTRFDIEVKWSTGADGWWKIYKGGIIVYEFNGQTCMPDSKAPWCMKGVQVSDWRDPPPDDYTGPTHLCMYYGDLRIERLA